LETEKKETRKSDHKIYGSVWACAQGFVEKEQREKRSWTKGQRKQGVNGEKRRSKIKKSTKILLTENGGRKILPVRQ
jgi:hypothetical protein